MRVGGARVMSVCGSTQDMRMLNMFPFAPHLAFWITHYGGTEFGVFVLDSGGGKAMGTEGNLRLIRKIKPDVLIGMPTFIYHVLMEAVPIRPRAAEPAKRSCSAAKKRPRGCGGNCARWRRRWARNGSTCCAPTDSPRPSWPGRSARFRKTPDRAGYHVHPDLALIEIVDPKTGEPRGEGEPGEIVFTPLAARGSVVLRYRTGDCTDGGLFHEPCPYCGAIVPRIVGEISRNSDVREMNLGKAERHADRFQSSRAHARQRGACRHLAA